MHPLLRNLMKQVGDQRAAYSRFEAASYPDGVACPSCGDNICRQIYVKRAPPWQYECAICEHRFDSMKQSLLAQDGDSLASWDVWLDVLARTIAFGPRPQRGNSRGDRVRQLCAELVAARDDIAMATFAILGLPEIVSPVKDDTLTCASVVSLPQACDDPI